MDALHEFDRLCHIPIVGMFGLKAILAATTIPFMLVTFTSISIFYRLMDDGRSQEHGILSL
jgi:hypothetical protein